MLMGNSGTGVWTEQGIWIVFSQKMSLQHRNRFICTFILFFLLMSPLRLFFFLFHFHFLTIPASVSGYNKVSITNFPALPLSYLWPLFLCLTVFFFKMCKLVLHQFKMICYVSCCDHSRCQPDRSALKRTGYHWLSARSTVGDIQKTNKVCVADVSYCLNQTLWGDVTPAHWLETWLHGKQSDLLQEKLYSTVEVLCLHDG